MSNVGSTLVACCQISIYLQLLKFRFVYFVTDPLGYGPVNQWACIWLGHTARVDETCNEANPPNPGHTLPGETTPNPR